MEEYQKPAHSATARPSVGGAAGPHVVIEHPLVPLTSQYTVQTEGLQPGVNYLVVTHGHLPRECPGHMECPHCNTTVTTTISYKSGWMTWLISLMLMMVMCGLCAGIPFFTNCCKDVVHSCPICNNVIHIHRLGDNSY